MNQNDLFPFDPVEAGIQIMAEQANAETKIMVESAHRSIGQLTRLDHLQRHIQNINPGAQP